MKRHTAILSSLLAPAPSIEDVFDTNNMDLRKPLQFLLSASSQEGFLEELKTLTQKKISQQIDNHNRDLLHSDITSLRDKACLVKNHFNMLEITQRWCPSLCWGYTLEQKRLGKLFIILWESQYKYNALAPCPTCRRESDMFRDHTISCGTDS